MKYQCPKCKRVFDFKDKPPYLYCPSCYNFDGQNYEDIALICVPAEEVQREAICPVSHYHGGMKQTVDGPYVLYAEIEEKNQRIKRLTEFSSLCVFVLRDLISHTSMGETKDFVYPRWVWEKVKEVLEEAER